MVTILREGEMAILTIFTLVTRRKLRRRVDVHNRMVSNEINKTRTCHADMLHRHVIITPLTDNTKAHRRDDRLSRERRNTRVRPRILGECVTDSHPADAAQTRRYHIVG